MDYRTSNYYSKNAESLYKDYIQVKGGISRYFDVIFQKKEKVLDIGCGSGRDILELIEKGHDAYGIEPCNELKLLSELRNPVLSGRIFSGGLPIFLNPFNFKFDTIILSAVLMHIAQKDISNSIKTISSLLKPRGKVLVSIPKDRPGIGSDNRDSEGRLFNNISDEFLVTNFNNELFVLVKKWESIDDMGREGITWKTMLFEKTAR